MAATRVAKIDCGSSWVISNYSLENEPVCVVSDSIMLARKQWCHFSFFALE